MAHLDLRISAEKTPDIVEGGVKDGPVGQKNEKAPGKTDAEDKAIDKAPDVLHYDGEIPSAA